MKLYYSNQSPYARATRIVLREVGLDPLSIEVESHPFDNQPDFIQANPLGKVPVLMLDEGFSLFDSEIICQFLDETYQQKLLWKEIENHWRRRVIYSTISGLMDTAVALRIEKVREADGQYSEFWSKRHYDAMKRGLDQLASEMNFFPNQLSLIQINVLCLCDYLTFRHPEIEWHKSDPLRDFYSSMKDRASVLETAPN